MGEQVIGLPDKDHGDRIASNPMLEKTAAATLCSAVREFPQVPRLQSLVGEPKAGREKEARAGMAQNQAIGTG